jgi:hypothetical protein
MPITVKEVVHEWIVTQLKTFVEGTQKFVSCLNKYVEREGYYVEKYKFCIEVILL